MHLRNMIFSILTTASLLSASTTHALTMSSPTTSTTKPLRVGVLYEQVQMSDLIGLDLLGYHTPEIMSINIQVRPPLLSLCSKSLPNKALQY